MTTLILTIAAIGTFSLGVVIGLWLNAPGKNWHVDVVLDEQLAAYLKDWPG